MALIPWRDQYNTGVEEIDSQHRNLVDIINELHEAREQGRVKQALEEVLPRLIDYTVYHFTAEEAYMEQQGYANLDKHREAHQLFKEQILEIVEHEYEDQSYSLDMLSMYLKMWLLQHILVDDMEIANFVRDHSEGHE